MTRPDLPGPLPALLACPDSAPYGDLVAARTTLLDLATRAGHAPGAAATFCAAQCAIFDSGAPILIGLLPFAPAHRCNISYARALAHIRRDDPGLLSLMARHGFSLLHLGDAAAPLLRVALARDAGSGAMARLLTRDLFPGHFLADLLINEARRADGLACAEIPRIAGFIRTQVARNPDRAEQMCLRAERTGDRYFAESLRSAGAGTRLYECPPTLEDILGRGALPLPVLEFHAA